MKIFRLGAKLQLFVNNNGITFKISKLIVGHIPRVVLGRKVTLQTLCTYDRHLRTLFMERRPVLKLCKPNNEKVNQNIFYRGAIA